MHDMLLHGLVEIYFQSRPNLGKPNKPLSIFFLACSGAGKSTLRKIIVEELGATYVCNDEVRALLDTNPDAVKHNVLLKEIVTSTWQRILAESENKMVVFDNNIIQYYQHHDSYLNASIRKDIPTFVIRLDIPAPVLEQRIIDRAVDVDHLRSELPGQIADYEKALMDIPSDWVLTDESAREDTRQMLDAIARHE
jgi:predicted kinase